MQIVGFLMRRLRLTCAYLLYSENASKVLSYLSQDEKRRKQGGFKGERKKIELEAVFDTTCKKCGTKGKLQKW